MTFIEAVIALVIASALYTSIVYVVFRDVRRIIPDEKHKDTPEE